MGPQHIRKGVLSVTQQKTGTELAIPAHPRLAEIIAATECGHLAFLVTATGAPFSVDGFRHLFREWCDAAGLPQCSAHGLKGGVPSAGGDRLLGPEDCGDQRTQEPKGGPTVYRGSRSGAPRSGGYATGLTIERIGMEAGCTAAWLFAGLQICIDARHAAAALEAGFRNKNDHNNARGIADLMRVDKYRPVWVKSPEGQ